MHLRISFSTPLWGQLNSPRKWGRKKEKVRREGGKRNDEKGGGEGQPKL